MEVLSQIPCFNIIVTAIITVIKIIAAVIMAVVWSLLVAFVDVNELECS